MSDEPRTAGAPAPRSIGPYEVVRELGRGGMGVVYEVRHPDLPGRALALKLILGAADGDALTRFGREAEVMARVRHAGVVQVHQLGRMSEGPFIVTDFVQGTGLDQASREGRLGPLEAAKVVRALADALAAVHAAGVLHRDLKPANVILREDGSPVLLDFGIARDMSAERLTVTGALMGTPAYMSPEQAAGESPARLDARVDVYGLGAILFELLAGRLPHTGDTPMAVVRKVLMDSPRWPSADRPDVPWKLEAICRTAMARDRVARYPDMTALRADLDLFIGGKTPLAAAGHGPPRGAGRAWAVGVVLLVVLLVGVGIVAVVRSDAPPGVAAVQTSQGPDPRREQRAEKPEAKGPASWEERVERDRAAGLTPQPSARLRHAQGRPRGKPRLVRALFLDARRVVTLGRDGDRTGWLRVWTLPATAGGPPQETPDQAVAVPLPDTDQFDLDLIPPLRVVIAGAGTDSKATLGEVDLAADDAKYAPWAPPTGGGFTEAWLGPGSGLQCRPVGALGPDQVAIARFGEVDARPTSRVWRRSRDGSCTFLFEVPFEMRDLDLDGRFLAVVATRVPDADNATDLGEGEVRVFDLSQPDLQAAQEAIEARSIQFGLWTLKLCPRPAGDASWSVVLGRGGGFMSVITRGVEMARDLRGADARPAAVSGTNQSIECAHNETMWGLAFDPDGRLWSASGRRSPDEARHDGELRAWTSGLEAIPALTRPEGGSRGPTVQAHALAGASSLAVSPDGRAIVVGNDEGLADVWILPPP